MSENGLQSLSSIEVFGTCPGSGADDGTAYIQHVIDVARWTERAGCRGILVYTDNSLIDPWLVSQIIIENTERLCPLVAVQPVYMHPYSVAKMVATLGYLYGRRLYLNMVAGGFRNDLIALNDPTPHDRRYDRLVEYTSIVKQLLVGRSPVTFEGEFYRVDKLVLKPPLPQELFPGVFVSASSDAGLAVAQAIGATAIQYPGPPGKHQIPEGYRSGHYGVRLGIIAREREDTAWEIAHARFPEDRKGQLAHQLAVKVSDSVWHKQLSEMGTAERRQRNPYWLVPFQNYKTFCPYLVGSYERIADELGRYIEAGYTTYILDIPPSEEELDHIGIVFRRASERVLS